MTSTIEMDIKRDALEDLEYPLNADTTDSDQSIAANDDDDTGICTVDDFGTVNEVHGDDDAFASQKLHLYQNSSLAAAQMMQLMNSAAGNASQPMTGADNGTVVLNGIDHEKENIPICKYCNKIFANFSNLNHHISAIHLNQSKWICSQCGKVNYLDKKQIPTICKKM